MSEPEAVVESGATEETLGQMRAKALGRELGRINATLIRVLEILAIVAAAALVLDVVWGVLTRAMPGGQAKWTEELARFLLIWVSMLGGALAFRRREHLGIDFLVISMHTDVSHGLRLLKQGIVCFAAVAVFLYGGVRIVSDAFIAQQTTPALGWKMGYVYAAVPLAGVFILFFALEEMLRPVADTANLESHTVDANEQPDFPHEDA